jgi:hypothetical protein
MVAFNPRSKKIARVEVGRRGRRLMMRKINNIVTVVKRGSRAGLRVNRFSSRRTEFAAPWSLQTLPSLGYT